MTKERLVEAITWNNPTGVADVIKAAKKTVELCEEYDEEWVNDISYEYKGIDESMLPCLIVGDGQKCVLAWGWINGHKTISVEHDHYSIEVSGKDLKHPYSDVVKWFDSLGSDLEAANKVLRILNI